MKKKLISLALVCAMVFALGVTALARDGGTQVDQDSTDKTGNTKVSYSVDPTYTITIPSSVALSNTAQSKTLKAENVILEGGKKITVTLTAASNTDNGESTFNAKNGDTSTATYTITTPSGSVKVGDKVAEFPSNGSVDLTFSAANTSNVTVAGDHTETLTFTITVKTAVAAPKYADVVKLCNQNSEGGYLINSFYDGTILFKTISQDEAKALAAYLGGDGDSVRVVFEPNGQYANCVDANGEVRGIVLSLTNASTKPLYYVPQD